MNDKEEYGVSEPSRRRLLKVWARWEAPLPRRRMSGGACGQTAKCAVHTLPECAHGKAALYGEHQAGILTPQQASMMLVAFDVLASDKADLQRLFRLLTQRIAFLTEGGRRRKPLIRAFRRWIPVFSGRLSHRII